MRLHKSILFSFVLLISLVTLSCEPDEASPVDVPLDLRALYDFNAGSYWVYQHSDDSTVFDTLVITERYPCGKVMVGEFGYMAPVASNGNGLVQSAPGVKMQFSDPNLVGFGLGFLKGMDDLWTVSIDIPAQTNRLLDFRSGTGNFYVPGEEVAVPDQSLNLPAGIFDAVVESDFGGDLSVFTTNQVRKVEVMKLYFEPGVGIVRLDIRTTIYDSNGPASETLSTWDLASWELK